MKQFSHLTRLRACLAAILVFLGLSLLLLGYPNLIIAQKLPQSRPPAPIAEKITRATLNIANRCPQPHYFRVSSDVKDPRFKLQTDAVFVDASSTKKIGVLFDAMGLKGSLKAAVECLDCKKEEGCAQDRYEVPIETTAVESALKTGPPVKKSSNSPVAVPGPEGGVLSGGLIDVPVPVLGVNYVGVIPERSGACPPGSDRVYIGMDDEDKKPASSVSGWTGDISRSAIGTTFSFCRVEGDQFGVHKNAYAVLKLSDNCPPWSATVYRKFDNENNGNRNWSSGNIAPNTIVHWNNALSSYVYDTTMYFCYFPSFSTGLPDSFPDLQVPYGVFAAPSSTSFDNGIVHTDDEDTSNKDFTWSDDTVIDWTHIIQIIYGTEGGPPPTPIYGINTDLRVARVTPNPACTNPCPFLGKWDNANCWVGKPPAGTTAIIQGFANQRNFDWTPHTGSCPTWYDVAPCFKRKIPSYTKPFIWSNMWYVEPVCRP